MPPTRLGEEPIRNSLYHTVKVPQRVGVEAGVISRPPDQEAAADL
jgi:hypothetical protein